MRYLCLGFHDEKIFQVMDDAERSALLEENASYQRMLVKNGHLLDGTAHAALQHRRDIAI